MLKNVVIINDFDYIEGGASKVAIQTANILANSDKNLNVYYFSAVHSDKSTLDEKITKVCTNQVEAIKNPNKLKGIIDGIYNRTSNKELKKLLETLNKDETVLHVHGWTKALSSSIFHIAFKMDYKIILTMHDYFTACPNGGYFDYKKDVTCKRNPLSWKCITCNCDSRNYFIKIYRLIRQFVQKHIVKLNKRLTDVISISDFSENVLKKTLSTNTKIHRVYNPIDLDNNAPKVDYTKNDYFLYVGRISPGKGVDVFCEAITKANVKGVVVGDGAELQNLKEKYPNIEFPGWKTATEVKEYMKKAKALIVPSKWYEAAPLTPLEAMQFGIPVIGSSDTATTEILTNENNIFENSNAQSLADIISSNKFTKEDIDFTRYSSKTYCEELTKTYVGLFGDTNQKGQKE